MNTTFNRGDRRARRALSGLMILFGVAIATPAASADPLTCDMTAISPRLVCRPRSPATR